MSERFVKFIEVFIPGTSCNFRCHYCYLGQHGVSTAQHANFRFSREQMKNSIDVSRLGGKCLFNFCADGETLLEKRTMEFIYDVLEEGHYAVIVTNGTLDNRFREICNWREELRKKIVFIFSYHHLELKRLNKMKSFFENVKRIKQAGCSYYVTVVQCEEYINEYDEIKMLFEEELGISPQIAKYRDDTSKDIRIKSERKPKEYFNLGINEFHSRMFTFERDTYEKKITDFCYAGDWQFYLNACTGEMRACYCQPISGNLFENPEEALHFMAIGNNCKCPYCYNGVARLPFGIVPSLKCDYYWEYQQCVDKNGVSSISDYMKEILSTKLYEENKQYSEKMQRKANRYYLEKYDINSVPKYHPLRIKRKIKCLLGIKVD